MFKLFSRQPYQVDEIIVITVSLWEWYLFMSGKVLHLYPLLNVSVSHTPVTTEEIL